MIEASNACVPSPERMLAQENGSLRKQIKRLKKALKDERALSSDFFEMYMNEIVHKSTGGSANGKA